MEGGMSSGPEWSMAAGRRYTYNLQKYQVHGSGCHKGSTKAASYCPVLGHPSHIVAGRSRTNLTTPGVHFARRTTKASASFVLQIRGEFAICNKQGHQRAISLFHEVMQYRPIPSAY
ncbi:hypothetical protein VCV18_011369 [Metarhizium anisopliae]